MSQLRERIEFSSKSDTYFGFTLFSRHPVDYEGKSYPSGLHLYQCLKFEADRPDIAQVIRASKTPQDASSTAHRHRASVRRDWPAVLMIALDLSLYCKFRGHFDLKALLVGTGSAELVYLSSNTFWGRKNGEGRNELGKALERLRAQFIPSHSFLTPRPPRPPLALPPTPPRGCIIFFETSKFYSGLSNFSDHPVVYGKKTYPTCEHLFQSFKFLWHSPQCAEYIRNCKNPVTAIREACGLQHFVRPKWSEVNFEMMYVALYHKFTQHHTLRELLLDTGDAELREFNYDPAYNYLSFWRSRYGDHKILVGNALMVLRESFRHYFRANNTLPPIPVAPPPYASLLRPQYDCVIM